MKDKIFNALKTEYKNLGFSEKALQGQAEALAATGLITDENLDTVVKGQKPALTAMQSEIDSRVTSAVEKAKKEKTPGQDPEPVPGKTEPPAGETPAEKAIRELTEKIAKMEAGKTHESLLSKVKEGLKAKNIPDAVINIAINGRTFEKEEDVEPFITNVETAHKEYSQELSNKGLENSFVPPAVSTQPAAKIESEIKDWAAKTNPKSAEK